MAKLDRPLLRSECWDSVLMRPCFCEAPPLRLTSTLLWRPVVLALKRASVIQLGRAESKLAGAPATTITQT